MLQHFYSLLERKTPTQFKKFVPERWRIWLGYLIKVRHIPPINRTHIDGLTHPLSLPSGQTEDGLRDYLAGFRIEHEDSAETLKIYLQEAFRRFLYTLQIVPDKSGQLLEIGANPYFTSILLNKFRSYNLTYTNFFGSEHPVVAEQVMINRQGERFSFTYNNVNVEADPLPFTDDSFDVVLLCEVLEHFTNDPIRVLCEIKRVLKPEGLLILTTPNVVRLENIARLLAGQNLYDPYSVHGPYGRHNREYTRAEVDQLLTWLGFHVEQIFTSDIHNNRAGYFFPPQKFAPLLGQRQGDLGEYIFVRAVNARPAHGQRLDWLYRGYPADE